MVEDHGPAGELEQRRDQDERVRRVMGVDRVDSLAQRDADREHEAGDCDPDGLEDVAHEARRLRRLAETTYDDAVDGSVWRFPARPWATTTTSYPAATRLTASASTRVSVSIWCCRAA